MKQIVVQLILIGCLAIRAGAQSPLEVFTNQADAALQSEFGCGITNIPIYSPTNPAAGYSASIHFLLQSAADMADAATGTTNYPSVFRPLFSWQNGDLFIAGYTCVTTDFDAQIGYGFKALNDPTISTNDNVWGIPWVIGTKDWIPAFNEYCYSSEILVARELLFSRHLFPNGQAITNLPPQYTNQFYIFSISNAFGAEAWNFGTSVLTNSMTVVFSNEISVTITNNYDFGTNEAFDSATNLQIDSWPGWLGIGKLGGFIIPFFTNTISLPVSYWSESIRQFVALGNPTNFLPSDWAQTGWPVHEWTLNITNNLIYALIDNSSGRVLDFVNLGAFGSSVNLTGTLNAYSPSPDPWVVAPADDDPDSPMSDGMLDQILEGIDQSPRFFYSLLGLTGGFPSSVATFSDPYTATADLVQSCSWQAGNPMVHYTVEDLTDPRLGPQVVVLFEPQATIPISLGNLGETNPDYNSGALEGFNFGSSGGLFQIGFTGFCNLPYEVWASTNLFDWSVLGTVTQSEPGYFQFGDPLSVTDTARFYQVRLP